jgi:hypothetical protein
VDKKQAGLLEIDFTNYRQQTEFVLQGLEAISVRGPDLLLGKIFNEIDFNQIDEELFRHLVLTLFSLSRL